MVPEEEGPLIVWRTMVPSVPFEEFEHQLLSQRQPGWNLAVGIVEIYEGNRSPRGKETRSFRQRSHSGL